MRASALANSDDIAMMSFSPSMTPSMASIKRRRCITDRTACRGQSRWRRPACTGPAALRWWSWKGASCPACRRWTPLSGRLHSNRCWGEPRQTAVTPKYSQRRHERFLHHTLHTKKQARGKRTLRTQDKIFIWTFLKFWRAGGNGGAGGAKEADLKMTILCKIQGANAWPSFYFYSLPKQFWPLEGFPSWETFELENLRIGENNYLVVVTAENE